MSKRGGGDDDSKEKKTKKAKKGSEKKSKQSDVFQLNANKAVDKVHETKSFSEIVKLPPSALQGLNEKADTVLAEFGIKTIRDMANWKYYLMAVAIVDLSKTEEKAGRAENSKLNINKALDKKHEKASFKEIVKLPLSAYKGLTESADEAFKPIGAAVRTIGELAKWKYFGWARSMTILADYEADDFKG